MGFTLSKSKYASTLIRVKRTVLSCTHSCSDKFLEYVTYVHIICLFQTVVQFWFSWPSTFKFFSNYHILNINLGLKFSYHWLPVKFMRWLASMARSLQFQSKLKHFLCWKCPRGWTRPLSNHKQLKSEPRLHLTFHLMVNLSWLLRQGELIFDLFPVKIPVRILIFFFLAWSWRHDSQSPTL